MQPNRRLNAFSCGFSLILATLVLIPALAIISFIVFVTVSPIEASVLNCKRFRNIDNLEGTCSFTRVSLVQPYYYRFPLTHLHGPISQQPKTGQSKQRSNRLAIQVKSGTTIKSIPLSYIYYTGTRASRSQDKVSRTISEFIADSSENSLNIVTLPSVWVLIFTTPLMMIIAIPLILIILERSLTILDSLLISPRLK